MRIVEQFFPMLLSIGIKLDFNLCVVFFLIHKSPKSILPVLNDIRELNNAAWRAEEKACHTISAPSNSRISLSTGKIDLRLL